MRDSANDSYRSGAKDAWRGWAWNRVVRRLPEFSGREFRINNQSRRICGEKTVLYLCGPEDNDREKLFRLGFRSENIFAVDVVSRNVLSVRKNGGLAIRSDIASVINNWTITPHIDVVYADLCCGIGRHTENLINAVILSKFTSSQTVLAVNLQRGRDHVEDEIRQVSSAVAEYDPESQSSDAFKNRGRIFFAQSLRMFYSETIRWALISSCVPFDLWEQAADAAIKSGAMPEAQEVRSHCDPEFDSYLSPPSYRIRMDSVVMRVPRPEMYFDVKTVDGNFISEIAFAVHAEKSLDQKTRRQLAATKAVRTMKSRLTDLSPS